MIVVLIVPTGIGAEIGGHAGDAGPVAKLIGACCDKLITHPNVVNGSDMNDMPDNTLYVEGSILDRFLQGEIELQERKHNRILVAVNKPVQNVTINAVSASRATSGIDSWIVELTTPLIMQGWINANGHVGGLAKGCDELANQIQGYDVDALAIHSPIEVNRDCQINYYTKGGVNPWGYVEAKASKRIADLLNKPVAHAPIETVEPDDEELYDIANQSIVDPRIAAESISMSYLHCVLKGLNKAPHIGKGISVHDVDFMISPYGCWGTPHKACYDNNVPIIMVKENKTILSHVPGRRSIIVENYLEAAGVLMAQQAGIDKRSVRRPLSYTTVVHTCGKKPNA